MLKEWKRTHIYKFDVIYCQGEVKITPEESDRTLLYWDGFERWRDSEDLSNFIEDEEDTEDYWDDGQSILAVVLSSNTNVYKKGDTILLDYGDLREWCGTVEGRRYFPFLEAVRGIQDKT